MSTLQLLKIEWYKLQRLEVYIILALYFLLITAISFFSTVFQIDAGRSAEAVFTPDFFLQVSASIGTLLIVIMVMLTISRERTNQSNRKRLINGYTRDDIYTAQFIQVKLVWGLFLVTWLLTAFCSALFVGLNPISFFGDFTTGQFLGVVFGFLAKGILAAFWITLMGKVILGLVLYFAWSVLETILDLIAKVSATASGNSNNISNFLPTTVIDNFMTNTPFISDWAYFTFGMTMLILLFVPYMKIQKTDY
ncbi:hypothetical protein [Penaeicola halotolerans]|uniref:hypothetical protein n=1 Tax=Penaeicola halotolerans TaxID=2793196 RepID=UPI001CF7F3FB|nr:hypothetical protein [Penaeicola halotolerans]